jgi:hypothetical protein
LPTVSTSAASASTSASTASIAASTAIYHRLLLLLVLHHWKRN